MPLPTKTDETRDASALRIKHIRDRLGCSQDEFARYLSALAEAHRIPVEVAYFTVRDWERGTRVPEGDRARVLELAGKIAAVPMEEE